MIRVEDGSVIEYGARWTGSPPEDTYSVDSHPERFAPLHTIADALIEHLECCFDIDVDQGFSVAADLTYHRKDPVRAVRLQPRLNKSAPMTIVLTSYPGVIVHAGLLHDFPFPICGCDACDETWEHEADRLEQTVLAIAAGKYTEHIDREAQTIGYSFTFPDGSSSGSTTIEDLPPDRLDEASAALSHTIDGWAPWPTRTQRTI